MSRTQLKAGVLGKLLLMQHTLDAMPGEQALGAFVAKALEQVPGVAHAHLCIHGRLAPPAPALQAVCTGCRSGSGDAVAPACRAAGLPGYRCIPVRTARHAFGYLVCALSDAEQFERYAPYLANTANVIATVLENREHMDLLAKARDELELKVTERTAELAQANARLQSIFDNASDAIFVHDEQGRFVAFNRRACESLGYTPEELLRLSVPDIDCGLSAAARRAKWDLLAATGSGELEGMHRRKDGSTFPVEVRLGQYETGARRLVVALARDITQRKQADAALHRLNRALLTLSECNMSLVHATSEEQLLHRICEILVARGGYRFVWVGYAQQDAQRSVRPMAHAGHEDGYLKAIKVTWADDQFGRGPVGTAIRTGEPFIARDIHTEARFAPWREEADKRGYRSLIGLPLMEDGRALGALAIYSQEADAFDEQEVRLLKELAGDLAFGIRTQRIRRARERALKDLAESQRRYQALYEGAPTGYLSIDGEGRILQGNRTMLQQLGYARETFQDKNILSLFPDTLHGLVKAKQVFQRLREGEPIRDQELQMQCQDGSILWVSVSVEPVLDENHVVVEHRLSVLDISKRKQAEEERTRLSVRLQRSLVQVIQAMAITIEKRDPYTAGHQQRVAELAVAIAKRLELPEDRVEGLRLGAMIHDIGKLYVPAEILNRPGLLSELEFTLIRMHPAVGYDILKGIEFPWPVAEIVYQHHERLDGSGYPRGLSGETILLESQILAVADVVEAMDNHRPYRPGLPVREALAEIRSHRGTRYNAAAVDACVALFNEGFAWAAVPAPRVSDVPRGGPRRWREDRSV